MTDRTAKDYGRLRNLRAQISSTKMKRPLKKLFVSKMDSHRDVQEHESCAKRLKLDSSGQNIDKVCNGESFYSSSITLKAPNSIFEGVNNAHFESGDVSNLPTVFHSQERPSSPDIGDFSSLDHLDTSQDSMDNDDDDDNASTISHLSNLSGLSELSGKDWKPKNKSFAWIQKQVQNGVDPRSILLDLGVDLKQIPPFVDNLSLWKIIMTILSEPPRRNKLRHVNSLDDVVRLLKGAQNVIVLTGAGVSVSCGIPDFRSKDGIYSRLALEYPDLPDPQAMFDINYFSKDPRPFFKFARDIYPGKFVPSPCHRFIKLLEKHNRLLRNYTQNIDTLEKIAEINNVIECHGSFATATCTKCTYKVTADAIKEDVLAQRIPICVECNPQHSTSIPARELRPGNEGDFRDVVYAGIMKPDIVFFGEGLPDSFHEAVTEDKSKCDLLLVIGSSLKVRPVALIPSSLPADVPQILINREPLSHCRFDVELLGDCDVIINHICQLLGNSWEEAISDKQVLEQAIHLLPLEESQIESISECSEIEITKHSVNIVNNETETNFTLIDDYFQSRSDNANSTKNSSLNVESDSDSVQLSITNEQSENDSMNSIDAKSIKERHSSIDSARDSGIGENSNFTDLKYDDGSDENEENGHHQGKLSSSSCSSIDNHYNFETSSADLRAMWQPKIKKSLADRLPPNSFHLIPPSRYLFPGAEIYYDPDEKYKEDNSTNSDSESENEGS